jgi:hypothetical protein
VEGVSGQRRAPPLRRLACARGAERGCTVAQLDPEADPVPGDPVVARQTGAEQVEHPQRRAPLGEPIRIPAEPRKLHGVEPDQAPRTVVDADRVERGDLTRAGLLRCDWVAANGDQRAYQEQDECKRFDRRCET